MTEDMNRFAFNTKGKICDYGEEEPKVLTDQEILEELNRLDQAIYELLSENTSVNWTNECLQEQLDKAIVPKFNRQEHICGFAFGEINEYIVVAYLDNDTTLCENIDTGYLEWCDNKFLVRTFEEAKAKLQELQEE